MVLLAETNFVADPMRWVTALLVLGGVGLYIAARFGTHALVGRGTPAGQRERSIAGGIALGHWAPTVAVSALALIAGRIDIAVGVAFGVSVAALLLALGMTVLLVPSEPLPATRRAWSYVLPAGLLIVVAGFGAALNLIHAIMLAVLGVCVLGIWRSLRDHPATLGDVLASAEAGDLPPESTPTTLDYATPGEPRPRQFPWRILQWALAMGLALLAARAVMLGVLRADASSNWLRAAILVVGGISPLLVLPLLATGTDLAQRNRSGEACSACVGLALLNLLGLLPLLIVGWIVRTIAIDGLGKPGYVSVRAGLFQPASEWFMRIPSMPLPMAVWRIDAVVLTIVGFALLPAALGKWRLGRIEAIALIAGYTAYLAVSAFLTVAGR